jgi:hypothetical protein
VKLLNYNMPDDFNLFHYGDVHDGTALSSKAGWEEFVDTINHKYDGCKNNFAIEGGDAIEAITIDDPRFSAEQLQQLARARGEDEHYIAIRPLEQMRYAIAKRQPIKKFLLCTLEGNHDRKLWRYMDVAGEMARELECDYGTYTAKISFIDKKGNLMFKVYETHGSRSINSTADDKTRRIANMKLSLKRSLKFKAGDCAIMIKHHAHKLLVCEPEPELYLTDEEGKITQHYTSFGQNEQYIPPDERWYGCAGSFLRMYAEGISGYAERFEYDPVELGWIITVVRDRQIMDVRPYYFSH